MRSGRASPTARPRGNEAWLADLGAADDRREAAVADLREYLLRAVLVYLSHHRSDLTGFDYEELRQMAEDWAQQAVLQVLGSIATFRGDSKFTTWAYRVAINLVAAELRRKRWDTVSLEGLREGESPAATGPGDVSAPTPEIQATRGQIWSVIASVIATDLTARQRTALTRTVLEEVPVEVVAAELGTNRNNLYKIVHDARRKLRRELESRGWTAEDIWQVFGASDEA